MSTVVCRGFHSQPTETTTLRLKLAAPKSIGLATSSPTHTNTQTPSNPEFATWSFLHSVSNSSQIPQTEKPYVTPSSSLRLSEKSLELCTESLGSENGSDSSGISCDFLDLSSLDSWNRKSSTNPSRNKASRKVNPPKFPPPLTSISGSNSLQVRTHREGGRLVMEAVRAPPTQTCFKAERSDGRLRLSFLRNCDFDQQDDDNQEDEEQCEAYGMEQDTDGNGGETGDGMGMGIEKFGRPSRCKEGGHGDKGLCNWEPFWVATS